MRKAIVTYEQFCVSKNQNVLLEEHHYEDGTYAIHCKHRDVCDDAECRCIRQLQKSLKISKTLQK